MLECNNYVMRNLVMNRFSNGKLNNKINLLHFIAVILVAVLTVNLALIDDAMLFVIFFVITAASSAWLCTVKGPIITIASSIIGWAIVLLITKNAVYGLLSVSYLPFSVTLPLIPKKKLSRSVAIGIGSLLVTVVASSVLIYIAYVRVGNVSLESIRNAFPYFFSKVSEILYDSFYVKVAGTKVSIIAESNVASYLNVIICLFPAALSALLTFVGFLSGWLYRKLAEITTVSDTDDDSWTVVPSLLTSMLFLIGLAITSIVDATNVFSLTALNFTVILFPLMLLSGLISAFTPIVTNGISRPRLLRPFLLIIAVMNGVVPFVSFCIFYGVYDSFKAVISKRKPNEQE